MACSAITLPSYGGHSSIQVTGVQLFAVLPSGKSKARELMGRVRALDVKIPLDRGVQEFAGVRVQTA